MVSRHLIAWSAAVLLLNAPAAWAQKAETSEKKAEAAPAQKPQAAASDAGRALSSKTMFYRLLARKQVATIEDAVRAVARFKGGGEELQPLASELEFLEKRGVHFPKDIVKQKDETLTMGVAAHMLMRAMGIRGKSVMYRFFPDNQRYAMREAVALGVISSGTFVGQTMSGNDLVGMLVRVNEVNEKQKPETGASKGY